MALMAGQLLMPQAADKDADLASRLLE